MESKREMALRHVLEGRRIVARQKALIETMRVRGLDTNDAESLLNSFIGSLTIFEDDLRAASSRSGPFLIWLIVPLPPANYRHAQRSRSCLDHVHNLAQRAHVAATVHRPARDESIPAMACASVERSTHTIQTASAVMRSPL